MKTMKLVSISLLALITSIVILFTSCKNQDSGIIGDVLSLEERDRHSNNVGTNQTYDICACIEENFPEEELSTKELQNLAQMVEEEKLARDVYKTLYGAWNENIFNNISKSEQQHMNAILCLYQKYNIDDLAGDNDIGVFEDIVLQELYSSLTDLGSQSLVDALIVGATIEDLDIFDLIEFSSHTDNEDILAVYAELTKGSRNHIRAFTSKLSSLNKSYIPQFITVELFEEIINSDWEKGGSICDHSPTGNNSKKGKRKRGYGNKGNGGTCDGNGTGGNNGGGNGKGNG